MRPRPLLCRLGFHAWRIPLTFQHAFHTHEECARCGKRRVRLNRYPGHAPVDERWLAGGEPSRPPRFIPNPGPTVQPPR